MYLQEILEVAIGLVFMWLVISLASMQLLEWVANLFKWRSRDMEEVIRRMLTGEDIESKKKLDKATTKLANELADRFYGHPLIKSLSVDPKWFERAWLGVWNIFRRIFRQKPVPLTRPSYIPSSKFSLALFDIVMNAGTETSPIKKAFDDINRVLDAAAMEVETIKSLDHKELAKNFLQSLANQIKELAGTPSGDSALELIKDQVRAFGRKYPETQKTIESALPILDQYFKNISAERQRITPLPMAGAISEEDVFRKLQNSLVALEIASPALKETLRSLSSGAREYIVEKETALGVARKNVETWFNDAMDRLSGWYKRKAQWVAFLIGLTLAILLNVDSINVATKLWREPTLRQSLVAYAEKNADALVPVENGVTSETPDGQSTEPTQTTTTPGSIVTKLEALLTDLKMPFGWEAIAYPAMGTDLDQNGQVDAGERVYDFNRSGAIEDTDKALVCKVFWPPYEPGTIIGVPRDDACYAVANLPHDWSAWLGKIAGLLITATAAAQGAPFWFDILKKLINVRSSGPMLSEEKAKSG